ncbi:MAG: hypothetical protein ACKO03_00955 [Bacteroidota bacterium]
MKEYFSRLKPTVFCLLLLWHAYSILVQTINTSGFQPIVKQMTESPFSHHSYWKGGDGAGSIDLGRGRVLWLFGDSFIGDQYAISRNGASLINNSIAIQQGDESAPH